MGDDTRASAPDPAEIPVPGEGERRATTRRRTSARVIPVVAAAAVLVAGVVAVRALDGDDIDADAALRRAKAKLAAAESYRLTVTSEDQSGIDDLAGPGMHTTIRVVDTVEVSGVDWRSRSDAGDWVDEAIMVDGRFYTRWGDRYTPIEGEQWAAIPLPPAGERDAGGDLSEMVRWFAADIESIADEEMPGPEGEMVGEMVVSMAGSLYLAGLGDPGLGLEGGGPAPFAADPRALADAIGALEDAEVVSRSDGGVTIRAIRRPPAEVVEALDHPVPDGRFEVVVDAEDRPVSLTLVVENDTARHTSRIEFSDWGATITIAAPAEGEIDRTPWLDEEALAEARVGITPVRPSVLPEGIELQEIYPIPAEEAAAMDEDCAQINLIYGPPFDAESLDDPEGFDEAMANADYLDVHLLPVACAQGADDTPFAPGRFGAVPTRDAGGMLEVLVGDTVVRIDTTYDGETLAASVTSIKPFDLDAEIARLSARADELGPIAISGEPSAIHGP
jgi:hypothetical protein